MIKVDDPKLLLKKFFEENSLIHADLESFNAFVDKTLSIILKENVYVG